MSSLKQTLRKEMLSKRRMMSKDDIQSKSKQIVDRLKTLLETDKMVGLFYPIQNEVDLRSMFNKNTALPKVTDSMKLHQYTGDYVLGPYKIKEPTGEEVDVDIVVVPGSVFDKNGYRIGYGGGYYDRYLNKNHIKIGVCFSFQVVDEVPKESHDVPLDYLVTEDAIYRW